MEFTDLTGPIPLGGVAALLFYLLRAAFVQQSYWERDRENLQESFRIEREALIASQERIEARCDERIEHLRNRVATLEALLDARREP